MVTLLLTYAFRCQTCNCANSDKLVLAADNRPQLVSFMAQVYLGCKYCGRPRAVDKAPLTDETVLRKEIT